jgi:hypothetical protein
MHRSVPSRNIDIGEPMRFTPLLSFALGIALVGCTPRGAGGGGGGGGNLKNISFQMPDDGSVVSAPFQMSATGTGILSVFFHVDSDYVHDTAPPYEYTIDPLTLTRGDHQLWIEVQGSVSTANKTAMIHVVRIRPSVDEMSAAIAALQPGEWYEIPETHMRDVDLPFGDPHGDQGAIIGAVSGGAYDTKRERYIVWGGGGTDIWRNEVTVFDMNTYTWIRLNDPNDFPPGGDGNAFNIAHYDDGAPVSRHSFCLVQYLPDPIDRLYVGGGEVSGFGGLPFLDNQTYLFNFDTLTWTPGVSTVSTGFGSLAAVDTDNRVWQHGGGAAPANKLSEIDVVAQTATEHVDFGVFYGYDATSDLDPVRHQLVAVGNMETRVWDLDNPDDPSVSLATSGDTGIEDAKGPGLAYHPPTGLFVAWAGGPDSYALDRSTNTWTRMPGHGSVNPGPQTTRGTFNRWRYIPSKNVFIVVNSVDLNVFVYRFQ